MIENLKISELEQPPQVSNELAYIAECELNETAENRTVKLKELRELLSGEDTELKPRTDTAFLLRFLRPAKFNAERALKMIKRYYKVRLDSPKMFKNAFTPEDQRLAFAYNLCSVLPYKDAEGRTLFLLRVGAWDPNVVSKEDFFMSTLLMMELSIRDVQTLIKGTVVIVDMGGLSMAHIINLTPDLRMIISMIQDCFPCRIKGIHIVNQPAIFSIIWKIIKHLLSFKMFKRMHLHGYDLQGFHRYVDPKHLPDFLGGSYTLDNSSNVRDLLAMNDAFYHDGAYGYIDYTDGYVPRNS